ncbi:MAG: hypothetical protein WDW36_008101 [Sanguina aurantia]
MLYDGGQLSLIKYPITRERPSYEVMYHQLGLTRVLEYIQLGLLDPKKVITMRVRLSFPLYLQVTACDESSRMSVQSAGGRLSRVYYTSEGLQALLHPVKFTSKFLPLPQPAVAWHPRYNHSFDALGQIAPSRDVTAPLLLPRSWTEILTQAASDSVQPAQAAALRFTTKKPQSSPRSQMGASRKSVSVRAQAVAAPLKPAAVPLVMEEGPMPINTFGPKAPFIARVKSVEKIVGPKATGETYHVIIETDGKIPYWEGQSYGVIPPGTKINSKGKEVAHGTRLYSIASSRYGDSFDGQTASLCVRRANYYDPETGVEDPSKKGLASNFLTDAAPGTEIMMTGPAGKVLLIPEDPKSVLIMVATGTGIAPFRSFWRRLFFENVPSYKFKGLFWLFMGAANRDGTLYDDELQAIAKTNPEQFRLDYALSREQKNTKGGKLYIQDKIEEYSDEVFDLMNNGAHMYFCGLKGMMPGITDMLERVAKEKGINYEEFIEKLKHNNQWHVEVY